VRQSKLDSLLAKYRNHLVKFQRESDYVAQDLAKYINQQLFKQSIEEVKDEFAFKPNDLNFFNQ